MSEPREPDQPGSSPPPGKPDRHSLAEEIRQELHDAVEKVEEVVEEAVEHVPQPVRWTVGKIFRLTVLILLALCVVMLLSAILYVANRTEWAARELTLFVNQSLAARSDVVLEIGDIKGNPFTGLRLMDPSVRFRDGAGSPLLKAPRMSIRYSAWQLVTGRRSGVVVEVVRPVLRLQRGSDGRLRLPTWKSGPVRGRGRTLDFEVRLRDATVQMPDSLYDVAGLELDVAGTSGSKTRAELRALSWKRGPFGSRLERCRGEITMGDSVRLRVHELSSPDLALHGEVTWRRGGGGERVVRAEITHVRWGWLARVFRNAALDVPGEGRFVVEARGDGSWRGHTRTQLMWMDLPIRGEADFQWKNGRIVLAPLSGESPAGQFTGRLQWEKRAWEISGQARQADPAHWAPIGIRGWPTGRLNGRFRYSLVKGPRDRSRLLADLGESEWSGWRVDSSQVVVDVPPGGPVAFQVHALRRGGRMTLDGSADGGGWTGQYTLSSFPLSEWPDGRASGIRGSVASGRGTVAGRDGGLLVTGELEGVATDWLGMHAARWRLDDMRGALLPTPDLTASIRLKDLTFLGVHWDSMATPFHLGDGALDFAGLEAAAGDTTLGMDGEAAWDRESWRFTAQRAELRSGQFDWRADPPLRLSGDPKGVTIERLLAGDGDARLTMAGRWAGPGGVYDWSAHAERLDLGKLGLPVEWNLAGHAEADLRVTGISGDPRWSFHATSHAPGVQGHAADSLLVEIRGAPSELEIDRIVMALDGGTLEGRGRIHDTHTPWPDTLTAGGVLAWLSNAAHWEGSVRSNRLPLDGLGRLAPAGEGWVGRLTGALEIGGRPSRPELTLNAEAHPLAWREFRLDAAAIRAAFHDGELQVPELRFTRGNLAATATGQMAVGLAVGVPPKLPESPMSWRIAIPDGDLALLPLFLPQVGSASGRLEVDARILGTPRHPDLSGTARVRDGRLRVAGREEVLEQVSATIRLAGSQILLDTLKARQGSRQRVPGRVEGRGVVHLEGFTLKDYRFDLHLGEFTAVEPGLYAASIDGDFVVTPGPRVAKQTLPLVIGNVELRRGVVLFDFANQSEVQQVSASTQPLFWTYRIHLSATDNLVWQPQDANIEFSADLDLEQTPDSLLIFGEMKALRGTYYFLSNRFTIRQADLAFDNVKGVDPVLAVEADTRLVPTRLEPDQAPPVPHTITVFITGRASEPSIRFASDPDDLDEASILAELTVGRFVEGQRVALGDPAFSYLARQLNRQLSAELSRAFRGYLTDWELARESGELGLGGGDLVMRVGGQVTPNLAVRYGQRLPGTTSSGTGSGPTTQETLFERDLAVEYRLNRFFSISSELTQRRTVVGNVSQVIVAPNYNISLKARWEY